MFMNDLSILFRQARVYADRRFSGEGSSFSEQLVLMYLAGHGPSSQMQIANRLKVDKGSIAKTIGKMEEKGFVEATVNERNRREKIVSLAQGAAPVVNRMTQVLEEWEAEINQGISSEERAVFDRVLERMAKNASALVGEEGGNCAKR